MEGNRVRDRLFYFPVAFFIIFEFLIQNGYENTTEYIPFMQPFSGC